MFMNIHRLKQILCICGLTIVSGFLHAAVVDVVLSNTNQIIRLGGNDIAFLKSATMISPHDSFWTQLQYQSGLNVPATITEPMAGELDVPLPLVGPGEIKFAPDLASQGYSPGIIDFQIKRGNSGSAQNRTGRYVTFAHPDDRLFLSKGETAFVQATALISFDLPSWTMLAYQTGASDPVSVTLPLWGDPNEAVPLVGPAVISFSPNLDGAATGFGIVGFEITMENARHAQNGGADHYAAFAHPDDRIRAGEVIAPGRTNDEEIKLLATENPTCFNPASSCGRRTMTNVPASAARKSTCPIGMT